MEYVGGPWWELQLLDGWRVTEHPECITLTHSEHGAFQLSAAEKRTEQFCPAKFMRSHVKAHLRRQDPSHSRPESLRAFTAGYEENGRHWQRFWLAHDNVLVFASYNGSPECWRSEQAEVYAMLATLRPRPSTNLLLA
jgi:hypothetical protein